jgi:cytochrome c oxidase accessory protein FixG
VTIPIAPERVLPTLNADGTRHRIRPRLYPGRLYRARRVVGLGLMALFVSLPFVRVGGKPAVLLDVVNRHFVLFGRTFLATDGVLLMLLMLSIFVSILLITAIVGRAWCGWACPQTVYMELLFRPLERLFEGPREAQLQIDRKSGSARRAAKNVVYLGLAFVLANVFLSYFVGTTALRHWVFEAPAQHPGGFSVVMVTTGLVFFDFAYFREQMCTVICPYARLQSVLLDPKSLLIGYDSKRGEPRSKGKAKVEGHGDCIDCRACVTTCPTGIDIREGLQLECIACGQCADACDSIMDRIKKPPGLIRYSSQQGLATGTEPRVLRPRVAIYAVLLLTMLVGLLFMGGRRTASEVTILRGIGAPFTQSGQDVVNQLRLKVQNRSNLPQTFQLELVGVPGSRLVAPELPLNVPAGEQAVANLFIVAPSSSIRGKLPIQLKVQLTHEAPQLLTYTLLGPEESKAP